MNAITEFLYNILNAINNVVGNYGVSIAIFTVLMRMVCMPFDYRSRKGMLKMAEIQPKLDALQKKYGDDKEKFQKKQAELMRKEHYNPLSGCLPLLLTWPLMIAMFAAMRNIANEKLVEQVIRYLSGDENILTTAERFLWIKNVWITDSPFAPIVPDAAALRAVPADVWKRVLDSLSPEQMGVMLQNLNNAVLDFSSNDAMQQSVNTILAALGQMPYYSAAVAPVPGWAGLNFLLFSITVYQRFNGLLIMPVLAGVTQILVTKLNPTTNTQPAQQNQQGAGMNAFMKWFFPVLSIWFCLTSNAGFAIYWVTSNIFMGVQTVVITKILENQKNKKNGTVSGEGTVK